MTEYLFVERSGTWQILVDGLLRGPFVSRQIAIDSAIVAVKIDFKVGKLGRVSVQYGEEIVTAYDSSTTSSSGETR